MKQKSMNWRNLKNWNESIQGIWYKERSFNAESFTQKQYNQMIHDLCKTEIQFINADQSNDCDDDISGFSWISDEQKTVVVSGEKDNAKLERFLKKERQKKFWPLTALIITGTLLALAKGCTENGAHVKDKKEITQIPMVKQYKMPVL